MSCQRPGGYNGLLVSEKYGADPDDNGSFVRLIPGHVRRMDVGLRQDRQMPDAAATDAHSAAPNAQAAAGRLEALTGADRHDVAIVLGSGWRPAADLLGEPAAEFDLADLGGFPQTGVAGHSSAVRSIQVGSKRVLAFLGRI